MNQFMLFVLAIVVIVLYCKNESFDIGMDQKVSAATANLGSYSGKAMLPDDYVSALVSSNQNDVPWRVPTEFRATVLEQVGYPMFTYNLPRMDDRQF